ncbi:E3 ubiquitin-protein ligase RNF212B isoform X2 [Procambarus clarkii]|uniref:E3 ubiquitin-protein ligase RNF212B isoform X2 n=1 Tax=Procambarus clarkii TaxID=6728 RepID=UPI001E6745E7|nr:RING finger protein 212B-like isoform X2 [Procambarus clarkii]
MDWINCNSCCRQPGDEKERTFVLTSCGHIFCDLCLRQGESRDKCAACSSQCQLIQLSSKMKPDAEMFFLEPAVLFKRHYTQMNRLLDFQKDHRVRLVSFHRRVLQKYKSLEKQNSSTLSHMQELEKKYTAAKTRIQELEAENQKLRNMVSTAGGAGRPSSLGHHSSFLESYPRPATSNKHSPQVSPGGTRISPGRLTLVKTNHGSVLGVHNRSPTNVPATTSAHAIPYGTVQTPRTPVSQHSSPPQPYHVIGHQNQQVLHSNNGLHISTPNRHGIGYFRSQSPSPTRTYSPTRSVSGSLNKLSLLPPNQLQAISPGLKPLQVTHNFSHFPNQQGNQTDQIRPTYLQSQPFTVHSVNTTAASPNLFTNQIQGCSSYGKYTM